MLGTSLKVSTMGVMCRKKLGFMGFAEFAATSTLRSGLFAEALGLVINGRGRQSYPHPRAYSHSCTPRP